MKKVDNLEALLVLGGEREHSRIDRAYEVHQEYPDATIIVSGGNRKVAKPEWQDMQEYLISKKVPAKKIRAEKLAIETFTGILGSWTILEELEAYIFGLITDEFHMPRALWATKRVLDGHYTVIPFSTNVIGTWRERKREAVMKSLLRYDLDNIHKVESGNKDAFLKYLNSKCSLYLPLIKLRALENNLETFLSS